MADRKSAAESKSPPLAIAKAPEPRFLAMNDVATALGISRRGADRMAGQLGAVRIGNRVLVPAANFEKFVATLPRVDAE